jgi:hypothetical protein
LVAQLPDDAYYYFGIARHLAAGAGSTFDGLHETNGYHPLWLALCGLLWKLLGAGGGVEDLISFARIAVSTQLVLGLLSVGLLAWAIRRTHSSELVPALVIAGSCSPPVIYAMTSGVESAFVLLFCSLLLVAFIKVRPLGTHPHLGDCILGLLLMGVIFSRLDLGLLAISLAGWTILLVARRARWDIPSVWGVGAARWLSGKFLAWLGIPGAAVLIYLVANQSHFGLALPISAILKSSVPEIVWHPRWIQLFPLPYLAAVVVWTWFPLVGQRFTIARPLHGWMAMGAGYIMLHCLSSVFLVDWSVLRWHFTGYWPFALVAGASLGVLTLQRIRRSLVIPVSTAALGHFLILSIWGQHWFLEGRANRSFQVQSYEAALWSRSHLPATSKVAMSDCGVYGYFRGERVINLDGVVNNLGYQESLRDEGLAGYLQKEGVEFIACHYIRAASVEEGYGSLSFSVPSRLFDQRVLTVV